MNLDDDRLTKKLFLYDYGRCKDNWSADVKLICQNIGVQTDFESLSEFDIPSIDVLSVSYTHLTLPTIYSV